MQCNYIHPHIYGETHYYELYHGLGEFSILIGYWVVIK